MNASTLGPRLWRLHRYIRQHQKEFTVQKPIHIWDGCCDHGYLGQQFLQDKHTEHVHFVDSVPLITQRLQQRLSLLNYKNYHVQTADVSQLEFSDDTDNTVILAGIGGDKLIHFLQSIQKNNPVSAAQITFALCPNYHCHALRTYLKKADFQLIQEGFVADNKQFYEVILVKISAPKNTVSSTGDFWQEENLQQKHYLANLMAHYLRKSQAKTPEGIQASLCLNDYKRVNQQLMADISNR